MAIGKPRTALSVSGATLGVILLPLLWNGTVIAAGRNPLPKSVALPTVAGWTAGPRNERYPWSPRFDGADHKLIGHYHNAQGDTVDLAIALYGWQAEGRKIVGFAQGAIDPASKWSWSDNTKAPGGSKAERMLAPGRIEREALTFYVLGPGATGDAMTVKLRTLQARLLGGDQGAAVVIVSAEGGKRTAIDAFLKSFGPVDQRAQAMLTQARGL